MKKEVIVEFGKKKPFLSSLYLDVSIDEIKAVKDKVVLQHLMEDVGACLLAHNSKFDADRLIGLEVLGSEGKVVGEVEDLKIEENFKLIPSLVIKVRKDALETMKMNKCLICGSLLNISMVHVVDVGDYVMLEATAENIGHILENITIQKE
jgi:sporulation protein YlmC with PRC-barrel domain